MNRKDEIKAAATYDRAAIDAAVLKDAYALWGPEGVKRQLAEMGPDRAARARVILDSGR